jgi:hypothetical protein
MEGRARFVRERSFENPNQGDAMDLCVLQGPPLKAVRGEQNGLLRAGSAFLVCEHLHILSLNRPHMVLAFDDNEKVNVERPESGCYVDLVLPVGCLDHLTTFHSKTREALTSLDEQIDSQPLQFRAVNSRTVIAGWCKHFANSA